MLECSNCVGGCQSLYDQVVGELTSWASTLESSLASGRTDADRLNSAGGMRDFILDRLRLPLRDANCSEWDNDEFKKAKLTEATGE